MTTESQGETMELHCLKCIEEYVTGEMGSDDSSVDPRSLSDINEAFTLVPTWQQTSVGNQMMMACVTVPVCLEHVQYVPTSPAQKAAANGRIILPG